MSENRFNAFLIDETPGRLMRREERFLPPDLPIR